MEARPIDSQPRSPRASHLSRPPAHPPPRPAPVLQLTATTQGLLSAQSALVDLHKKNSGEKDSGDKEMKELRDDVRGARQL